MLLKRNKIEKIAALKESLAWDMYIYTKTALPKDIPEDEKLVMKCYLAARMNWSIYRSDRMQINNLAEYIRGFCDEVEIFFEGFTEMCRASHFPKNEKSNDYLYGKICAINELAWWSVGKDKKDKQDTRDFSDPLKPVTKI